MSVKHLQCNVEGPGEADRLGVFANAFRVLEGETGAVCLEFLVYSGLENKAQVASRVHVPGGHFLVAIRDQLEMMLTVMPPQPEGQQQPN